MMVMMMMEKIVTIYNSVRMRLDEKILPLDSKNDDSMIRGDYDDDDDANDYDNHYDEL